MAAVGDDKPCAANDVARKLESQSETQKKTEAREERASAEERWTRGLVTQILAACNFFLCFLKLVELCTPPPAMAPKNARPGSARKKKPTREAQYNRAKAADAASRMAARRPEGSSSKAKGKAKAKEVEENPHPFRYKSFNDRLTAVHINVSNSLGRSGTGALAGLEGHGVLPVAGSSRMQVDSDSEDEDDSEGERPELHAKTSFGIALLSWKELNLSLPFTLIAQQMQPLSLSLPMLLHHQATIARLLGEGLDAKHRDSYLGYEPLLDLVPRLANDLGSSFLPCFPVLLAAILRITTISKGNTEGEEYMAAMLVERAFESAAATLRCVAPFVLREQRSVEGEERDWLQSTWQIVRPYLGKSDWEPRPQESEEEDEAGQDEELHQVTDDVDDPDAMEVQLGQDEKPPHKSPRRPKVPPHTRRFASEALAHLVRRAKGEQLSKVADVMMKDLQDDVRSCLPRNRTFASGIAGVWVEVAKVRVGRASRSSLSFLTRACQSVDHRLHSSATFQLSAVLLARQSDCGMEASTARIMVGNNIITALVHHGQAPHLVPLFKWLADVVEERMGGDLSDITNLSRLHEAISWLISFVGTRKGKRIDDSTKPRLFRMLEKAVDLLRGDTVTGEVSARQEASSSLLQFVALGLPLGRIQDLVGPGRRIVERLASSDGQQMMSPAFSALAISLGQSEFEFDGFRQIVLPAVMSTTMLCLADECSLHVQDHALSLLATLQQQGQFVHLAQAPPTATTTAWARAILDTVEKRLHGWGAALESGERGDDKSFLTALSLVAIFPAQADRFVGVICQCIGKLSRSDERTRSAFEASPFNPAGLLGTVVAKLADLVNTGTQNLARLALEHLSTHTTLWDATLRFAWHRHMVCSLAQLGTAMQKRGLSLLGPSLEQVSAALEGALMSADEPLRLAAVQLLSIAEKREMMAEGEAVLVRLVEIEETPLQVETVRERNVRMRAVVREVIRLKNAGGDTPKDLDQSASIVARYLISVFKLNFRPLWEESRKALVDLSSSYGQMVWEVAFSELKSAKLVEQLPSSWSSFAPEKPTLLDKVINEEEEGIDKQFRDPQLAERRQLVLDSSRQHETDTVVQAFISVQRPGGRLDVINYQGLLLKLFASIHILAERNNAPLMQHFFENIVARREVQEGSKLSTEQEQPHLTMTQRRGQLCAYLDTFAQFTNPKALFRSQELHHYLYTLCSQGDNQVQRLALDVILQWKDPSQVTYAGILKQLTDQSNFREQLTSINLAPDGDTIQESHRVGLLPLLIRLFFGIMVSKRGRASQGSGQAGRKNAILVALADLPASELEPLVEVMLEPLQDQRGDNSDRFVFAKVDSSASLGRQSGYLSMLGDVIKHLGLRLIPLWHPLVRVTLNLTYHASRRAAASSGKASPQDRTLRQTGLRRLDDFFKQPTAEFDWSPYMAAIFQHLVSPRLASLRTESVQSPSALLDLIHTWSNTSDTVFYLVDYDAHLLEHVCACLPVPSVKPSVIARVLDIIEAVLSYADGRDKNSELATRVETQVLRPCSSVLLAGLTPLVERCNAVTGIEAKALKKDDLLRRLLQILSQLSTYVTTVGDATTLLDALSPMLRKNNAVIGERSKVDLLLVFERLLLLVPEMRDATSDAFKAQYALFSGLLSKLRTKSARTALCSTLANFAQADESLERIVKWIQHLNSFDAKRMEEYDFEKRLAVFDIVNEGKLDPVLSTREWLPLLHNCLFNLQDAEELAIRANAGSTIRNFIRVVASTASVDTKESAALFTAVVYPGLRKGLRSKSDLVQREVVAVLGYAVSSLGGSMDYLGQMTDLLVSGDEEASFFNNIFHIQLHRRIRALNRLGQEAEKGSFSSRLIVEIFLPLVDQFLDTDTHHGDANLIQGAVECLGKLSMRLKWGPYNVLLWKFLSIGKRGKDGEKEKEKDKSDKVCVRAAMSILDDFHFQMEEPLATEEDENHGDEGAEEMDYEAEAERLEAEARDSKKVLGAVQNRLLPKLMDFLDQKDELEDTVRLPIAVGVARVVLKLPHPHRRIEMGKLLNTLSNVFKSKAQDTRDLARLTLGRVAVSLGPDYLPMIVKELRRALTRGPQRAVLAFTVHNVLTQAILNPEHPLKVLTAGTADIVDVVMEDVFGQTSEDRESIENRTTYKEVKVMKSLDTLEQVAKVVDPSHVATLLAPTKRLMQQTEAIKAVRGMDDYLKRVAVGLNANAHLSTGDLLLLCHSLLTSNADFLKPTSQPSGGARGGKSRGASVLRKRSEVEEGTSRNHYARNAYKFVVFGLDMLGNALRRARLDYSDRDTLAKLDPMISAVGNCLYAQQAAVITTALKDMALLVRCPVPSVEGALPFLIKQTLRIVDKEGSNAQSDILMAALKLLTVVIRDVHSSGLQDNQLRQLCRLIDMNLEESVEMQGVLFGLLRAIVGRKFVLAEVYDVMDKVATMMVTNQSTSIRDLCRSTYLTFLLELPQGQQRFSNQMHFLAKNVSYVFESGRLSLLDFLRLVLLKMDEEVLRDYLDLFFVALVMCLGNDESSKCKEKAAKLIVQIVELSREEEKDKLIELVHVWAQPAQHPGGEKRDLARIAMMIYGLLTEAPSLQAGKQQTWKGKALVNTRRILAIHVADLEDREEMQEGEEGDGNADWQLPYQALQVVGKLYANKPYELETDGETWKAVRNLLLFPHTWVRTAACRLLGQRLSLAAAQKPQTGGDSFLSMGNLLALTRKMCLMLKSDRLSEALALQIVKNLVFIGRCFALVPVRGDAAMEERGADEEDVSEDGGANDGEEDADEHDWSLENPLRWLFTKLSHQLRQCKLASASVETLSLVQPSSILKWFAAMVNHLAVEQSRLFTMQIIAPLYHLLEADANLARKSEDFAALQALASEVQDLVQQKVGTTAYAATYTTIRQRMAERKKKRKNDALMMAIQQPERAMERKAALNKRKHDSRKRKTQSYANNKERVRPLKRQR